MKYLNIILRVLVGGLFIFSGLIKVNDPVGTSIKLEEYFEVFSVQFADFFHVFVPVALPLGVFIVVLEVVLGVAIIINYKPKLTQYTILALIVFFTFLTGYSAITNTVTDCGCFGDAIKLTPWESFTKDIILLVMIGLIIVLEKEEKKDTHVSEHAAIVLTTLISVVLSITAINHLPFLDFRAYKIGDNITTNMQPSADFKYEYVVSKDGEEFSFSEYPTDPSYTFVSMTHINPEASPKITDFAVWNDDGDFTEDVLKGNKLFVILYDVTKADEESLSDIKQMTKSLGNQVKVYVLTASASKTYEAFAEQHGISLPYYFTDATVLKTIVRSNPGAWLLQNGTVKGKWHYNDVPNYSEVLDLLKL